MSLRVDGDVLQELRRQKREEDAIPPWAGRLRAKLQDAKKDPQYAREIATAAQQGLSEIGEFPSWSGPRSVRSQFADIHAAAAAPLQSPSESYVKNGLLGLCDTVRDAAHVVISSVVKPVQYMHDAALIAAKNAPLGVQFMGGGILSDYGAVVASNPEAPRDAAARMEEREQAMVRTASGIFGLVRDTAILVHGLPDAGAADRIDLLAHGMAEGTRQADLQFEALSGPKKCRTIVRVVGDIATLALLPKVPQWVDTAVGAARKTAAIPLRTSVDKVYCATKYFVEDTIDCPSKIVDNFIMNARFARDSFRDELALYATAAKSQAAATKATKTVVLLRSKSGDEPTHFPGQARDVLRLATGRKLVVKRVSNEGEIGRVLAKETNVSTLWITADGNPTGISLGRFNWVDGQQLAKQLPKEAFAPNAQIVLESCSTGGVRTDGRLNVAEQIYRELGGRVRVIAPKEPIASYWIGDRKTVNDCWVNGMGVVAIQDKNMNHLSLTLDAKAATHGRGSPALPKSDPMRAQVTVHPSSEFVGFQRRVVNVERAFYGKSQKRTAYNTPKLYLTRDFQFFEVVLQNPQGRKAELFFSAARCQDEKGALALTICIDSLRACDAPMGARTYPAGFYRAAKQFIEGWASEQKGISRILVQHSGQYEQASQRLSKILQGRFPFHGEKTWMHRTITPDKWELLKRDLPIFDHGSRDAPTFEMPLAALKSRGFALRQDGVTWQQRPALVLERQTLPEKPLEQGMLHLGYGKIKPAAPKTGPTFVDSAITTPQGGAASLQYSWEMRHDGTLTIFLDWIGVKGLKAGDSSPPAGLYKEMMRTFQKLAQDQGASRALLQLRPDNKKLGRILERRFPFVGHETVLHQGLPPADLTAEFVCAPPFGSWCYPVFEIPHWSP